MEDSKTIAKFKTANNLQMRVEENEDRLYFTTYRSEGGIYRASKSSAMMLKHPDDIRELIKALQELL